VLAELGILTMLRSQAARYRENARGAVRNFEMIVSYRIGGARLFAQWLPICRLFRDMVQQQA